MGPPPLINKEGKPVPLELLRGVKLCNACRAMFKASTSLSLISLKQPVFLGFFKQWQWSQTTRHLSLSRHRTIMVLIWLLVWNITVLTLACSSLTRGRWEASGMTPTCSSFFGYTLKYLNSCWKCMFRGTRWRLNIYVLCVTNLATPLLSSHTTILCLTFWYLGTIKLMFPEVQFLDRVKYWVSWC